MFTLKALVYGLFWSMSPLTYADFRTAHAVAEMTKQFDGWCGAIIVNNATGEETLVWSIFD